MRQLALVNDRDEVGHHERFFLCVGHVDRRDAKPLLQISNLESHLFPEFRVQVGQRLVEKQNLRLDDERASQRDALLLPTRQLIRRAVLQPRQLRQLHHFVSPALNFGGGHFFDFQPVDDVVEYIQVRENRIALKHHRHIAAVRRHVVEPLSIHDDAPRSGKLETRDEAQCRRLAATRRAEQRDELPLFDIQRDVVHSRNFARRPARGEFFRKVF